jgi:hypothetical protein
MGRYCQAEPQAERKAKTNVEPNEFVVGLQNDNYNTFRNPSELVHSHPPASELHSNDLP